MKLYRGLKSKEFSHFTSETAQELRAIWTAILRGRARGDFRYPRELNDEILRASKLVRLQRQHFTDNRAIAAQYAKSNGGVLIEIDVPTKDIVDHFTIEFQNFGQRKKRFEIVYVVDSRKLLARARKWKLKAHRMSERDPSL